MLFDQASIVSEKLWVWLCEGVTFLGQTCLHDLVLHRSVVYCCI